MDPCASADRPLDSLTTLGSLALEVSDRKELLDAIFAKCHVLLPQVRMHYATMPTYVKKITYYSRNYSQFSRVPIILKIMLTLHQKSNHIRTVLKPDRGNAH